MYWNKNTHFKQYSAFEEMFFEEMFIAYCV